MMEHFRCPKCEAIAEVVPKYGDEIVSVYCLRHRSGKEPGVIPVYMKRVPVVTTTTVKPEVEPIAA